jgi:hypothetical protein
MGSRAYAFSISAVLLVTAACVARAEAPTPELYVAKVSGGAQVIPAGNLKIDGHKTVCGQRPTVLDNSLDDYAAAYPGFLIINSKLLSTIKSTPSNSGFTPTSAVTSSEVQMKRQRIALPFNEAGGRVG